MRNIASCRSPALGVHRRAVKPCRSQVPVQIVMSHLPHLSVTCCIDRNSLTNPSIQPVFIMLMMRPQIDLIYPVLAYPVLRTLESPRRGAGWWEGVWTGLVHTQLLHAPYAPVCSALLSEASLPPTPHLDVCFAFVIQVPFFLHFANKGRHKDQSLTVPNPVQLQPIHSNGPNAFHLPPIHFNVPNPVCWWVPMAMGKYSSNASCQ